MDSTQPAVLPPVTNVAYPAMATQPQLMMAQSLPGSAHYGYNASAPRYPASWAGVSMSGLSMPHSVCTWHVCFCAAELSYGWQPCVLAASCCIPFTAAANLQTGSIPYLGALPGLVGTSGPILQPVLSSSNHVPAGLSSSGHSSSMTLKPSALLAAWLLALVTGCSFRLKVPSRPGRDSVTHD